MTTRIDDIRAAYRAYLEPLEPKERKGREPWTGWPPGVLVFDCETTTDPTQRLLFGAFRYAEWTDERTLRTLREGLLYADDLPDRDPAGYATLVAYVEAKNTRAVAPGLVKLELMSRREFVDSVLWKAFLSGTLIVGFNLPFDLSRLAIDAVDARAFYNGGFSLPLWDYLDEGSGKRRWNPYRPRIQIKPIDPRRALLGATGTKAPQPGFAKADWRGHFLDLKTLSFALTDAGHTLASACEAFSAEARKRKAEAHGVITPEYIDYCRQDVRASLALLERVRTEFDRHDIKLDPCHTLSPATIAKGYLRAMGITPPMKKFRRVTPARLGQCMSAYFGGRAEARIRREIAPVVMLDVLSMYPTTNTLMGNLALLTARDVRTVDATAEVRELLATVTPERVFDPAFWRSLHVFAEIEAAGDILPVRARYGTGREFTIGVNAIEADSAWYALPDLVASTLSTGRPPKVLRAFRVVGDGQQSGLKPVRLAGQVPVNPTVDDFFKAVIEARSTAKRDATLSAEERERLDKFFKVLANSGAYGIFAEINEETLLAGEQRTMRLHGLHAPFEVDTHWPEEGGEYFWPPLAALITSGARLVLALLERCVTDAGGTYAFCDTDSMAVVATARGGPLANGNEIHTLSWAQVDEIVARFAGLNPYNPTLVPGSILKIEKENFTDETRTIREQVYALVISAKRYVLFNRRQGKVHLRKCSEHGLGLLIDPTGPRDPDTPKEKAGPLWIQTMWRLLLAKAGGPHVARPAWLTLPAVTRVSITSPDVLERFGGKRRNVRYADRVKPFNFLLSAHLKRFGHPGDPKTRKGENPLTFHLMAPFSDKPKEWLTLPWIDRGTGKAVEISTTANLAENVARVQSYADVLDAYWAHPEAKSAGADGAPCGAGTSGLLYRRHVRRAGFVYVSKEARRVEEVQEGQVHNLDDISTVFVDPKRDPWKEEWLERLTRVPLAFLAARTSVSEREIRYIRNDHRTPKPDVALALEAAVVAWERKKGRKPGC